MGDQGNQGRGLSRASDVEQMDSIHRLCSSHMVENWPTVKQLKNEIPDTPNPNPNPPNPPDLIPFSLNGKTFKAKHRQRS